MIKTHHLVFNRGAVTWACSLDNTAKKRRAVKCLTYYVMCLFIGRGDVTGDLTWMVAGLTEEREAGNRLVTGLLLEDAEINRFAVNSRRGSGLKPAD